MGISISAFAKSQDSASLDGVAVVNSDSLKGNLVSILISITYS